MSEFVALWKRVFEEVRREAPFRFFSHGVEIREPAAAALRGPACIPITAGLEGRGNLQRRLLEASVLGQMVIT